MGIVNFIFCIVLFFLIGVGLGFVGTILFFRMDEQWKQLAITLGTMISTGSSGIALVSFLHVDEQFRAIMFVATGLGLAGSIYFTFKKLCSLLKGQTGKNVIRIMDIVIGRNDFLTDYYESRKKAVDNEIQKEWHSYEEKNKRLIQREEKIKAKEEQLRVLEENIKEQIEGRLSLELPVERDVPPSSEFIRMIPSSVSGYNVFVSSLNEQTQNFIKKLSKANNAQKIDLIFKSYLAGIGMLIATHLFGTSKKDVRTHFRISDGNTHQKYTVIYFNGASDDSISEIPCGNSLIEESYRAKRAIVASLNSDHTYNTNSGSRWEDYMTYSFQCASKDNTPFLSMGISIKGKNDYKTMLWIFNYFEIELCIESAMKQLIGTKGSILQTLESLYGHIPVEQ